jgi:hypothetical protein
MPILAFFHDKKNHPPRRAITPPALLTRPDPFLYAGTILHANPEGFG